jgi:carbonic anhydrase/acetyltransferase-like protein (isoleucine patch superfamily)
LAIYEFEGRAPRIAQNTFVAPSAQVIGDVYIGANCYLGHGAIVRGDYGTIYIEEGTAIEEGVIIHARPNKAAHIGKEVTVGHGAMIHNAAIEDYAVIGMRATISDDSTVGLWSIIGEMSLVRHRQVIPPGKIAVGVPAVVIGDVQEKHKMRWRAGKLLYQDLVQRYLKGMHVIREGTYTEAGDGDVLQKSP